VDLLLAVAVDLADRDLRELVLGEERQEVFGEVVAVAAGGVRLRCFENVRAGGQADVSTFADALEHVLEVEVGDKRRAMWSSLSAGQRRTLTTGAENAEPAAVRRPQRHGLIDASEVVADPSLPTGHRVIDPLLAHWVRAATARGLSRDRVRRRFPV
jgi:hypothetical protein